MKKLFTLLMVLTASMAGWAQNSNDYLEMTREVLSVEKKAAIAEIMVLTEEESAVFWEMYNDYQNALYKVHNERIAIIRDFADNYETMTDEKADELWQSGMRYREDLHKLKKSWYAKFKKELPAGKVVTFFQAESKIETLVDAQLALEIPLLDTE